MYIYDYLLKRNLQSTAKAFMAEGKVAADPVGNHLISAASLVAAPFVCLPGFSLVSISKVSLWLR